MKIKSKLLLIVTAITLVFSPKINFGQAPDLGMASDFALFTAGGAFNNIGASSVMDDIGSNSEAVTGFPPGVAAGTIYNPPDATLAQAATDVDAAYSYLSTLGGSVLGVLLGNDQILTPGVYNTGAASTLNGNLILDGEGNPDALFIIRIGGAFATSASSNVILINSASLFNVYWQIGGQFDLGDGSVFRGTIIVDGAINLLDGSTLYGKGFSRAGAISLHNNTVAIEIPPLPIKLMSFVAYPTGVYVELNWSTASETNNDYFTVQRSKNGITFEEILQMHGAGNSNKVLNYSAIDYTPYGYISYYRLKQTDFNGIFTYSNLVAVDFIRKLSGAFNIYPNPFSASTTITINDASQINNCVLRIYNVLGENVINTTITKRSTTLETSSIPSGIYFYNLINNNKIIQSGKLISQ